MPGVTVAIEEENSQGKKPLKALRILGFVLHMTIQTAVLIETLGRLSGLESKVVFM